MIMNPGVMAPSSMLCRYHELGHRGERIDKYPMIKRQANRPPKEVQAACDIRAMDHRKIQSDCGGISIA
jgi:hypothetical protein